MQQPSYLLALAASKRRALHISLEDIARSTNISIGYLRAIERGRIDELPGGIYARSYVRQYAQAIGMDESELLDAAGLMHPEPVAQEPEPRPAGGLAGFIRTALRTAVRVALRQQPDRV